MRDYIQRMRGIADPGKKIAVQAVLTGNGDYEYLCETVRQIKRKTHETGEGQLKMTSPRERMYIVVVAPICMASESSRKKIEKTITGKETKTGPEPKKIREIVKDLHAAGFDLGPDYANTMVTWVGPGTGQDSQDPYTSARMMSENLERTLRQALSMLGVLPLSWSVTRTLIPQMGNWYEKGIFVTSGRSAGQHHFMALVATLSMILPMDIDLPREGHPNFQPSSLGKAAQMPSKGRVRLCLNSQWGKRVGGTINGWYKALIGADNENKTMGDASKGLVRETVMERSEIFFPYTRRYGDVIYMATARDREEEDIFAASVQDSVGILEKMLRKGSTGKSGAEGVARAMRFIEAYVALADPDWEALADHKRYALDPSSDDDVDMSEPCEGDGAGPDEPREKPASTHKRASPTPERHGKEIKRHEKSTAWQKGTGKASDADDENVTGTESRPLREKPIGRAFRRQPEGVRLPRKEARRKGRLRAWRHPTSLERCKKPRRARTSSQTRKWETMGPDQIQDRPREK